MSTPNRTARKAAAITTTANRARTAANKAVVHPVKTVAVAGNTKIAKPTLDHSTGSKGKVSVYDAPKPARPKPVKK